MSGHIFITRQPSTVLPKNENTLSELTERKMADRVTGCFSEKSA
jgi:hypothetical protein